MGYYSVNFGDYCLAHSDNCKYFDYFEFKDKKYPIGAYVNLTESGERHVFDGRGHGFLRGGFRLVDHYINDKGVEGWTYIIGKSYETKTPFLHSTIKPPDELISQVLCAEINETSYTPGELKIEFKEPNYFPSDWEVDGVMLGWLVVILVWIGALVFKDWWITLIIQIGAGWYFGSWREKKINKAISTQKFKKND